MPVFNTFMCIARLACRKVLSILPMDIASAMYEANAEYIKSRKSLTISPSKNGV